MYTDTQHNYAIRYTETYEGTYYVKAGSFEEAKACLEEAIMNGRISGPELCCDTEYSDVTDGDKITDRELDLNAPDAFQKFMLDCQYCRVEDSEFILASYDGLHTVIKVRNVDKDKLHTYKVYGMADVRRLAYEKKLPFTVNPKTGEPKADSFIQEFMNKNTYADMSSEDMSLVVEYETKQWAAKIKELMEAGTAVEEVEEKIHDLWLNFEIADDTEKNLWKLLNF